MKQPITNACTYQPQLPRQHFTIIDDSAICWIRYTKLTMINKIYSRCCWTINNVSPLSQDNPRY